MPDGSTTSAPRSRTRLAAIRALSWRDRALLVEAAIAVPLLRAMLRVFTFQRVHRLLGGISGPRGRAAGAGGEAATARVGEIARVVAMASRHAPVPSTCLHRSLALWWLLRRRGFASDLRFGARMNDGQLEAHAWIEYEGAAVNDDQAATGQYTSLPWTAAKPTL